MQTHNNQPSRTYQLPRRRSCNAIDIATTINTTICQQYAVFESTAGGEYICEPCSIYHIMQWGGWYLQQPNRLAIEHTTINLYLFCWGIEVHIGVEESMSLLCIASLHNCMTTQYTHPSTIRKFANQDSAATQQILCFG